MDVAALAGLILVVGIFALLALGIPISVAVGLSAALATVSALGVEALEIGPQIAPVCLKKMIGSFGIGMPASAAWSE